MREVNQVKKRRGRHPWDLWFSLRCFYLVRGKHFACRTDTMAQQIRVRAAKHGVAVRVLTSDDLRTLTVEVTQKEAVPCSG